MERGYLVKEEMTSTTTNCSGNKNRSLTPSREDYSKKKCNIPRVKNPHSRRDDLRDREVREGVGRTAKKNMIKHWERQLIIRNDMRNKAGRAEVGKRRDKKTEARPEKRGVLKPELKGVRCKTAFLRKRVRHVFGWNKAWIREMSSKCRLIFLIEESRSGKREAVALIVLSNKGRTRNIERLLTSCSSGGMRGKKKN